MIFSVNKVLCSLAEVPGDESSAIFPVFSSLYEIFYVVERRVFTDKPSDVLGLKLNGQAFRLDLSCTWEPACLKSGAVPPLLAGKVRACNFRPVAQL